MLHCQSDTLTISIIYRKSRSRTSASGTKPPPLLNYLSALQPPSPLFHLCERLTFQFMLSKKEQSLAWPVVLPPHGPKKHKKNTN